MIKMVLAAASGLGLFTRERLSDANVQDAGSTVHLASSSVVGANIRRTSE